MLKCFKGKRGSTLSEVLVYMALAGILLTGVATTLIFSIRYHKSAQELADLQNTALITLTKLSTELSESNNDTIEIDASGTSTWIIFASTKNMDTGNYSFDSEGEIYWQKWIAYYLEPQPDGTKNLVRKQFPINPPVSSHPGTAPYNTELAIIKAAGPVTLVAKRVAKFEIKRTASYSNYLTTIIIDRTTDTTKPSTITAETEISLRN